MKRLIKTITFAALAAAVSFADIAAVRAQNAALPGAGGGAAIPGTPLISSNRIRLKEIAKFEGARSNQLTGMGLVTGLDGTGGSEMASQMIKNLMENMGVIIPVDDIDVDNTAVVMVTATLPPFARGGDQIDITVSSLAGQSLRGGTLIQTPLKAANDQTYVVAAGPVSIGGFNVAGGGGGRQKAFSTVGVVTGGGIVERDVPVELVQQDFLFLNLNHPDFTTASRVAEAINRSKSSELAHALTAATVRIEIPQKDLSNTVDFIADIENIAVEQDQVSKIVVNERTGTIIIGGDIRVAPVAIAHGSIRVKIESKTEFSEGGGPFAAQPVAAQQQTVSAEEPKAAFRWVNPEEFASVRSLVDTLNEMGVTPTDVIAILQALKTAGALQAEIVLQ